MPGEDDPHGTATRAHWRRLTALPPGCSPIPLPTDAKRLADLLADYLGKLGIGGLRR